MIIDGSENKIPLNVLKESKIINEKNIEANDTTDDGSVTASQHVFDSFNKLPKDVFVTALLSFIVDYADANGISEKEIVAKLEEPMNSVFWELDKLLIKSLNVAMKKGANTDGWK